MNKANKKLINLFLRYMTILLLATFNFFVLRTLLTTPTLHLTNLIIKIFTPTTLTENIICFSQTSIQIAIPCVAPAAFYLLIALIFSTANIKPKLRLKAVITATATLFVLNITRILILAALTSHPNFETIHWFFWHIASTIFVVATYMATIKFYKIKSFPIISDFKYLRSLKK